MPRHVSPYLTAPYDRTRLRCVEHHRALRLAGYCPSCVLRRIDEALQAPPGYGIGPGWEQALLEQIHAIIESLRATQVQRARRSHQRELGHEPQA